MRCSSMNIDELLLSINDATFDNVICQLTVQTEVDKLSLQEKGYGVVLTESEFREQFSGVDPKFIYYSPSMSLSCFYFNPESLAVCPFHIELFIDKWCIQNDSHFSIENCYRAFAMCENEVASGDYKRSILSLPDRMRLEYFGMLFQKFGKGIRELYKMFFDAYIESDYGFNGLDKELLTAILESKTDSDRKRTEEAIRDLPDVIHIYRGGNTASCDYRDSYSWTLDINVANFFACRRGSHNGYIVEATVSKSDIIDAFLDNRHENEIIVDPSHITVIREITVYGIDFLSNVLPDVTPVYQEYRERLRELRFSFESSIHGIEHAARVLLLTQIIAHMMDVPMFERKILALASIYHDTRRTHDGEDGLHGRYAREHYNRKAKSPSYLVEFLCEFHCLPDEQGYAEIRHNKKLSRNRRQATRLLQIFKDADALDRLRLGGIRELDINQLRLDVSKQLTLVSRMCLEQIKV